MVVELLVVHVRMIPTECVGVMIIVRSILPLIKGQHTHKLILLPFSKLGWVPGFTVAVIHLDNKNKKGYLTLIVSLARLNAYTEQNEFIRGRP